MNKFLVVRSICHSITFTLGMIANFLSAKILKVISNKALLAGAVIGQHIFFSNFAFALHTALFDFCMPLSINVPISVLINKMKVSLDQS